MNVRFLIDEHVDPLIVTMCKQASSGVNIVRVGDPGAPPLGTLDPDLLLYCEAEHRLLLTRDYSTMPRHIRDHLAAGHHHGGVLYLRPNHSINDYVHEVQLISGASRAHDWQDVQDWIPF